MQAKFEEVCAKIRAMDPEAEMVVPCKFHPRCRPPTGGGSCRFSHVPYELRDSFFMLQDLAAEEQVVISRSMSMHRQKLKDVHHELLTSVATRKVCIVVTYSYNNRVHGTEYVYPSRKYFFSSSGAGDFSVGMERYINDVKAQYPGTVVYAVRLADVSPMGTADAGHPVRESFFIPTFGV